MHYAGKIETPIGQMTAIVDGEGALVRLDFSGDSQAATSSRSSESIFWDNDAVLHVNLQIAAYFRRELEVFNLRLAPLGNSFLQEAWSHLAQVPYGTTTTYGELARRLDKPTSARAIGRANAINPISIVLPCHRVLGANGKLTGYSGGLERKAALLRLEGSSGAWAENNSDRLLIDLERDV